MSAYECYADAVKFAYPHRVEELASYRKYLLRLFDTVGLGKQKLVIQFDQSFRTTLANNIRLTFDDVDACNALLFTMFG